MVSTADLRKQLARLEAQILHLRRSLVFVERQRLALKQHLHKIATFPVLTLPTEITVEIFTHCLPGPDDRRSMLPELIQPPIVFLAVCRAWRAIAHSTPALWSELHMRFDEIPEEVISEPGQVEKFVHDWLGRARLRPLSLVFDTDTDLSSDILFPISRIRDIIHCYAPRIAYLELYSSQEQIRKLDLGTVAFPLLRHAIIIEDDQWPPDPADPVPVLTSAPQLTELSLRRNGVQSSYVLPALQLTTFEGQIDDLEFFTLVPNLLQVKCYVDLDCNVPDPPAVITHAGLQSLTLLDLRSEDDILLDILPYLNLPKLETLDISVLKHDIRPSSIMGFLDRSGAQLRSLAITIDNVDDYYVDWFRCLARLDDIPLENLTVWPCPQFLGMLLRKDWADKIRLPRLKSLTINEAPLLSYEFLLDSLTARSSHLKSFRISFQNGTFLDDEIQRRNFNSTPGYSKDKICNYLARLVKAGMRIQIDSTGRKKPVLNWARVRRNG